LKVVGTGLGRTGTLSLKLALEQLGLGPCHHMIEVFMHPQSVPLWVAAGKGKGDWDAIFSGYQAMVDYPGCRYWRELMDFYPDAKLVHSLRDPDKWFDSTQATIFAPGSPVEAPPEPMREFFGILTADFGDKLHDRAFMTDYFRRHTAEVVATVPKDRLLVFEAAQGWEPLCAFLGVPVPESDFPRENSTADFQSRAATRADPAALKAVLDQARGAPPRGA
jgi:hypothetical protein